MIDTNREVHLAARPAGLPKPTDFELVETPIPEPGDGELLVRNIYMSVDPYMRGRMRDAKSYVPPFQIGEVLSGGAVGQVVESNHPGYETGDFVTGFEGWRQCYKTDGTGQRKIDPEVAPLSTFLGVLGMPGITAYVGLLDIGKPKVGETLLVSAAAGAVGSLVGQLGKIKGCRVVGSTGSPEKVELLTGELGFDAAFNYKGADLRRELAESCPDGIDVYFENVGGPMLEAVLAHMNPFGRIPVCGMIAHYNDEEPTPGPTNLFSVISKRLLMQGFICTDRFDRLGDFTQDVGGWLREGRVKHRETIVEGIDHAADAFIGLLQGENTGKMLVQVGDDPTRA
ncbi:MAG TPA: NADP-dependent oxidoreductase [Acidobacteriota bacterium]|nr:NADP-dependent oxidoreductase [Acidobacteriota bacterium]